METQATSVTLSGLKGIDAPRLERELSAMWAGMSGEGAGGGVVRACALNLIVYAEGPEERAAVDALLDEVVERHPSRSLVVVADRAKAEASLEAYISTRCQLSPRGAKQICGEQITIEAGGAAVETAWTAVAPLLVPDVPVFLWWKDIPHYDDDRVFGRLAALADRVVIDSASFDRPHFDFIRLSEILEAGRLRLSDINWGRLTSWRSVVAGFWDVADYRPSLARVERVAVNYDPPDRSRGEIAPKALLAVGWIATCLDWEPEDGGELGEDGRALFRLRDGGRTVEVELTAGENVSGRDGMITSLALHTADGDEFHVALRASESLLETWARVGGGHRLGRVLSFEARTEGRRLSAELDILSRDALYERAVGCAAKLLRGAASKN